MVVTIVVLIILATISINAVMGDNGLIKRAEKAAEHQSNAEAADSEAMSELDQLLANAMSGNGGNDLPEITDTTPAGTVVKTPSTWTTLVGKAISDGNGTAIPLPDGFYYVGGDYDTGLVISDKENDTMDASGVTSGNQFVWIPVESEATFIRESFEDTELLDETIFKEPLTSGGYSTEEAEYNAMKTQVVKYGGFYIGRYEAGVNSTTLRTGSTESPQEVVSKKGVAPYNYVKWGDDMAHIGINGAVYIAQNMYTGKTQATSVTSTLVYGVQWDAMCRYIGENEYTATTLTKDAPELTGSVLTDEAKNIYDLAGNCMEWTMEEMYSFARIYRGGCYSDSFPVLSRNGLNPDFAGYDYIGFRCGLYVK